MKTLYYTDLLGDDFAGNGIDTRTLDESFPFVHTSALWRAAEAFMYYCFAVPIVFLISKFYLGLRIENRKALKKLRGRGWFLYCSHTRALDAFVPALAAFPQKAFITCGPDAVSIKGIAWLVQMLGGLPIPGGSARAMRRFVKAVNTRFSEKNCVAVFPEAHIWPFYNGVRPFTDASFRYPANLDSPVVAGVTLYRKRTGLFFWCRRPGMTVRLSEPFYPDETLKRREAQKKLRDEVYDFMRGTIDARGSVEYIRYEKKEA